jgi:uncharacterized protein (DUF302 family)
MSYYIARSFRDDFNQVVAKVTQALKTEGFGVLTEIDVAATLKQKLGADMPAYRILGACNPGLAQKALAAEDKIGVMLPCNVIVRDAGGGMVEVAAIDPRAAMKTIGNPALAEIADAVAGRLARAVDAL